MIVTRVWHVHEQAADFQLGRVCVNIRQRIGDFGQTDRVALCPWTFPILVAKFRLKQPHMALAPPRRRLTIATRFPNDVAMHEEGRLAASFESGPFLCGQAAPP